MLNTNKLYLGVAITFAISFIVMLLQTAGIMPAIIIGGSMLVGVVLWFFTTYKIPANPKNVLPIYLITIAILLLHIWEEYLFDFGPRIAQLNGSTWSEVEFLTLIAFYLPVFWILGAIGLYYRHPLGNAMIWFIFIGMAFGEPVHLLVFPILDDGRYHYFPGMWSALFPLVTSIWGMSVLIKDYREESKLQEAEK